MNRFDLHTADIVADAVRVRPWSVSGAPYGDTVDPSPGGACDRR